MSVTDIPTGTVIMWEMIAIKQPGYGIPPKFFDSIVGRTARRDIAAEEAVCGTTSKGDIKPKFCRVPKKKGYTTETQRSQRMK